MSNEKLTGLDVLVSFFDEGSFVETDACLKGTSGDAEALTGYGTVDGMTVFAFAQDSALSGGAMSTAQSRKITKLYAAALKVGAPIVGFYDSVGGRLSEGGDLLAAYGEILRKSSKLSGVVPQISVVLGNCLGTAALIAYSADFVIMTADAQLSVDTLGTDSSAEQNIKNGTASFAVDSAEDAIAKAKSLLSYLPSNNLEPAPAFEPIGAYENADKTPKRIADDGSLLCVGSGYAERCVCTALGRVGGIPVGFVVTKGGEICSKGARKIYRFVRFCDAFSIPLITIVDAERFSSLKDAGGVINAYAEATTAKIALIEGCAIGATYIALAGMGSGADVVLAFERAVISPVAPTAAAYLMAPDTIADAPAAEQEALAMQFVKSRLTAQKAAEDGTVDAIVDDATVRARVLSALELLATKRVATLPKKHSTLL